MAKVEISITTPNDVWLDVKANGGSVTVRRAVGDGYIEPHKFTSDFSGCLDLGPVKTWFVPAGGAEYELTDISGNNIEASR